MTEISSLFLSTLIILLGVTTVVLIGGTVVSYVMKPFAKQLERKSGLEEGGRMIGYCERLLIFVFVLVDSPNAVGLLVAAKSIYSFGGVSEEKHKRSQYIIIGTLVSFAYGVTVSYLVRWGLRVTTG